LFALFVFASFACLFLLALFVFASFACLFLLALFVFASFACLFLLALLVCLFSVRFKKLDYIYIGTIHFT
jgi:hypothetical protein